MTTEQDDIIGRVSLSSYVTKSPSLNGGGSNQNDGVSVINDIDGITTSSKMMMMMTSMTTNNHDDDQLLNDDDITMTHLMNHYNNNNDDNNNIPSLIAPTLESITDTSSTTHRSSSSFSERNLGGDTPLPPTFEDILNSLNSPSLKQQALMNTTDKHMSIASTPSAHTTVVSKSSSGGSHTSIQGLLAQLDLAKVNVAPLPPPPPPRLAELMAAESNTWGYCDRWISAKTTTSAAPPQWVSFLVVLDRATMGFHLFSVPSTPNDTPAASINNLRTAHVFVNSSDSTIILSDESVPDFQDWKLRGTLIRMPGNAEMDEPAKRWAVVLVESIKAAKARHQRKLLHQQQQQPPQQLTRGNSLTDTDITISASQTTRRAGSTSPNMPASRVATSPKNPFTQYSSPLAAQSIMAVNANYAAQTFGAPPNAGTVLQQPTPPVLQKQRSTREARPGRQRSLSQEKMVGAIMASPGSRVQAVPKSEQPKSVMASRGSGVQTIPSMAEPQALARSATTPHHPYPQIVNQALPGALPTIAQVATQNYHMQMLSLQQQYMAAMNQSSGIVQGAMPSGLMQDHSMAQVRMQHSPQNLPSTPASPPINQSITMAPPPPRGNSLN